MSPNQVERLVRRVTISKRILVLRQFRIIIHTSLSDAMLRDGYSRGRASSRQLAEAGSSLFLARGGCTLEHVQAGFVMSPRPGNVIAKPGFSVRQFCAHGVDDGFESVPSKFRCRILSCVLLTDPLSCRPVNPQLSMFAQQVMQVMQVMYAYRISVPTAFWTQVGRVW